MLMGIIIVQKSNIRVLMFSSAKAHLRNEKLKELMLWLCIEHQSQFRASSLFSRFFKCVPKFI